MDEQLLQFIRATVKSVWALELLLVLRRDKSNSGWTVDRLTEELRSSRFVVSDVLSTFKSSGLVTEAAEGRCRYCAPYAIDRLVGMLESEYATRPAAVVKAILSAPNDKIQTFADAFRLRKDG
jgi:hypothetical protein